jgi:apolipoprotein N-acyltransferase
MRGRPRFTPSRFAGLVAAALAGLSLALAAPPSPHGAPAFAFAPLLLLALRSGPLGFGRGFSLGLVSGVAFAVGAVAWAIPLVERFGGYPRAFALAAFALLGLWQALPPAIGCGLAAAASRDPRRLWFALPLALSFAFSATPVLFPWRPGHMAMPYLTLVQIADLGGLGLVDLTLGLVGCGLVTALLDRRWAPALVAVFALASALVYGAARMPIVEAARQAAPTLRVGVVQPDVRVEEGLDPGADEARAARLRAMTVSLEAEGVDFVAWPEAAYPFVLDRAERADRIGPTRLRRDGVRGPVVFGAMTARGRCERWNSVIVMDEKGRFIDRADKQALFPFAELVPLWHVVPKLQQIFPCPGLVPGRALPLLEVVGARVGLMNCYEDVTDRFALSLAPFDPEILLVSASDAWYGDSAQPLLHHLVSRFRAIELRRDLVRVLNTGESSHTSATGRDLVVKPVFERASFIADARRLEGLTVYAFLGDWVSPLAAGILLAFALERRRASIARA